MLDLIQDSKQTSSEIRRSATVKIFTNWFESVKSPLERLGVSGGICFMVKDVSRKNTAAQFNLALQCANGRRVVKNELLAYQWFLPSIRSSKLVEAPREDYPAPPSHPCSLHRLGFF
jgi:hypothetical protein